MSIKEEIKQDLDDGKFGQICSNEDTFIAYVFAKIDQIDNEWLKLLEHLKK